MTTERPDVSVIIVNWNAREALLGCLQSLADHPPADRFEVIVVDNGSADGSVAAIRSRHPDVRVIVNGRNRGLPAANNQGMAAARGAALLICNPDVIFPAGAAEALVQLLDRHPKAGIVVPRLRYPDGGLQTSAGDLPTLGEALLGRQAQRWRRPKGRGGEPRAAGRVPEPGEPPGGGAAAPREPVRGGFWWDGWAHDEERPIGRGHEAAYAVRRAAAEHVGPQDEGFRLDWEGIDWTARFRDAGWEVWLCPAAEVVHLGGASIRQVPFRWVVWSHRGMYRYFAKRRPRYWRPALALLIGVRAVIKGAATAAGVAMYERGHRRR
jgi:GT2 family glycosyltransferase